MKTFYLIVDGFDVTKYPTVTDKMKMDCVRNDWELLKVSSTGKVSEWWPGNTLQPGSWAKVESGHDYDAESKM